MGLILALVVFAPPAYGSSFVDLRSGSRTVFYGEPANFYGWAMAFGDVNGDGATDFLSSSAKSQGADDLFEYENDVYLIFGRPRAEIDSVYAVGSPGETDIIFHRGGFAMACADIDHDGYDDVVLANNQVYIVYGAPRDQMRAVYDFNPSYPNGAPNPNYTGPDIHVVGSTKLGGAVITTLGFDYDTVLRSLATGDLNGDGFSDVVLGNHVACEPPGACLDGAAYVIFGRPRSELPPVLDVNYASALPHPDVLILGDTNDHYAANLAIGDLDGDGIDDLLTSAWAGGENNTAPGIGEVHGWWGKNNWKPVYDTQIDDFDFALQGTAGSSAGGPYQVGYRMDIADVDGDGKGDLLLGTLDGYRAERPSDRNAMAEYRVIFGRPRGLWSKWNKAVDMTDVLILGANSGDGLVDTALQWGICFSFSTGNVDNDQFEDILVGAGHARREDGTRPGGGYLIHGRPRGQWEPFIDLRNDYDLLIEGADFAATGGYVYDLAGFCTAMGDLDGNGRDELFIAAPFADGPNNSIPDCGEIYVIYDDIAAPTSTLAPPFARAALLPNFPNPFNASTTFRIAAPRGANITLTIYDALGREVARPIVHSTMAGNEQELAWNAVDASGHGLPSGVYFAKLRAGNETHARKVLLVR